MQLRSSLVVPFALVLHAQEPAARPPRSPAAEQLSAQLAEAAAVQALDFEAEWKWARSMGGQIAQGGAVARVLVAGPAGDPDKVERAAGRCHGDVFRVRFEREEPLEFVFAGRHTAFRVADGAWQLGGPQTQVSFVPDPQLVLRALGSLDLDVLDRSIGERDGRAVEQVAVTLTNEQVSALCTAGAMQQPNPMMRNIERYVATGRMRKSDMPLSVVDVAVEFDVETRQVTRVRVRSLSEPVNLGELMRFARGGDAGEAEADDAPRTLPTPTEFEGGLPVREAKELEERTFELRLSGHGAAAPVELDADLRRLLGR